MIRYIAQRLLLSVAAIWLAATVTFVLIHAAPGDPALALGGDYGATGYLEDIRRAYGLDRPIARQYADWLWRLCRGDLGYSYRAQAPVAALIFERSKVTLALMVPAIALATILGTLLGLVLASRAGSDRFYVAALAGLHALPSYVIAHLLIAIFALQLGWFPVQGLADPRSTTTGDWAAIAGSIRRLFLPVLTLALAQSAFIALIVRARVREELAQPYARTAFAKGLRRWRVLIDHALPNAATGILTLTGWRLGTMLGGTVVIETVFALPGLGRLVTTSAIARDHPVVIGIVLVACSFMIIMNLCVDVLAHRIDPRLGEERP